MIKDGVFRSSLLTFAQTPISNLSFHRSDRFGIGEGKSTTECSAKRFLVRHNEGKLIVEPNSQLNQDVSLNCGTSWLCHPRPSVEHHAIKLRFKR